MTDHRAEDAVEAARQIVKAADMVGAAVDAPYEHRRAARMNLAATMRHEFGIIKLAHAYLALLSRVEEVRKETIEECAKVADGRDNEGQHGHYAAFMARRIADDIRSLPSPPS